VLLGERGADRLVGGQGADRLTGGTDGDTFVLVTLKDSLLSGVDRITDFAIGIDWIDGSRAIAAGQVVQRGSVRQLNAASIAAVLTRRKFVANSAATLTKGSGRRQETFLVLNNHNAGFSAKTDAIINITGYSGSLVNLAIG
jgi:Ca2+-binding RTX toxin-like protein